MREILFRGKEKESGKWIYGDLRHISDERGGYDCIEYFGNLAEGERNEQNRCKRNKRIIRRYRKLHAAR